MSEQKTDEIVWDALFETSIIEWAKGDPQKVYRLMQAEKYIGGYGKIILNYHNGKCSPPIAQSSKHIE